MPRILAVDYGQKRTGLAVSDGLKIIATALDTIATEKVAEYLRSYLTREEVECFVVGLPLGLDGRDTDATAGAKAFGEKLTMLFPGIPVVFYDERFTSKIAGRAMLEGGMKKKDRQKKENLDKISAVIILQGYMQTLS